MNNPNKNDVYKETAISINIKEVQKPLIALDGSEHFSIESLERANKEYWDRIITKSAKFKTLSQEEILLHPSIQIMYYQNVIAYLKKSYLKYNEWKRYYEQFKNKLSLNNMTPEFALLFAETLYRALVIPENDDNKIEYDEKIGHLLEIIEELNLVSGKKRN